MDTCIVCLTYSPFFCPAKELVLMYYDWLTVWTKCCVSLMKMKKRESKCDVDSVFLSVSIHLLCSNLYDWHHVPWLDVLTTCTSLCVIAVLHLIGLQLLFLYFLIMFLSVHSMKRICLFFFPSNVAA